MRYDKTLLTPEIWADPVHWTHDRIAAEIYGSVRGRMTSLFGWATKEYGKRPRRADVIQTADPGHCSTEINDTGDDRTVTVKTRQEVKSLGDLVRVCKIDLTQWTIDRYKVGVWEVGMKQVSKRRAGGDSDETVTPVVTPLYVVTAWLKANKEARQVKGVVDALIDRYKDHSPAYLNAPVPQNPTTGLMIVPSIYDAHFGKLAWPRETGFAAYDLSTAASVYDDAVDYLLGVSAFYGHFERALIAIGNDALHIDNRGATTTAGTVVDCDTRLFKMADRLLACYIRHIEKALAIADEVKVTVVPGNHDANASVWMGMILSAHFRHTPRVVFDTDPRMFKYEEFGEVLLGLTHGERGKKTDYGARMAFECKEAWGRTTYREFYVGHGHREVVEGIGVKVRMIPSLASPDSFLSDNNLVGKIRQATAFIHSRTAGPVGSHHFVLPPELQGAVA